MARLRLLGWVPDVPVEWTVEHGVRILPGLPRYREADAPWRVYMGERRRMEEEERLRPSWSGC